MKKNRLFLILIMLFTLNTAMAQLETWYEHHVFIYPTPNLNSVAKINDYTGFTCGDLGIIGIWTMPVNQDLWIDVPSPTTKNLYSLFIIDSTYIDIMYIVGESGKILKTNEVYSPFTMSFSNQNSSTDQNLYSVWFTIYSHGIAVGDTGTVVRTTDGGSHWSLITSVTQNRLYSVHFPSANIGYAVGNNGTVIKTTDNGQSWLVKTQPVADSLRCVWFTSDNTGFVVCRNGGIYKTTDGGNNWQIKPSGISQNLNAIRFSTATTGYAAGNNNKVLKTIDGGETWTLQILPPIIFPGNYRGIDISETGQVSLVGSNATALGNYPDPGSVNEHDGPGNILILPNPAKDKMVVYFRDLQKLEDSNILIYNIQGQKLWQQDLTQHNTEINISQLKQGVYFLKMEMGNKTVVKKLIKY